MLSRQKAALAAFFVSAMTDKAPLLVRH